MGAFQPLKILFIAEAVTLAHVTRPLLLAAASARAGHLVTFATDRNFDALLANEQERLHGIQVVPIASIPAQDFLRSLYTGKWLYTTEVLSRYVEAELKLFRELQPDLVVGDLRYSLAVSARVAKIPYVSIANAYWSPYSAIEHWPAPPYGITKLFGIKTTEWLFQYLRKPFFQFLSRYMNGCRKKYGLPPFENFLEGFTQGDHTFLADTPLLAPTKDLPAAHTYLGPLVWSPAGPLPPWWNSLPSNRAMVYLTLGSSGDPILLKKIIQLLGKLNISVCLATAGMHPTGSLPANVFAAPFLPGDLVSEKAKLVVSNGGSPTSYQALRAGTPVLGVPSNLDQLLAMIGICNTGAGEVLRADAFDDQKFLQLVDRMLRQPAYRTAAKRVALDCRAYDATEIFLDTIEHLQKFRNRDFLRVARAGGQL
jgi:UDP:flavonoid glycosyltransferase YjiC (YdhE family)